jgi:hypothetical protein
LFVVCLTNGHVRHVHNENINICIKEARAQRLNPDALALHFRAVQPDHGLFLKSSSTEPRTSLVSSRHTALAPGSHGGNLHVPQVATHSCTREYVRSMYLKFTGTLKYLFPSLTTRERAGTDSGSVMKIVHARREGSARKRTMDTLTSICHKSR